jgi:hypothetical protein
MLCLMILQHFLRENVIELMLNSSSGSGLEPILRLLNLQQQRLHFSRLDRYNYNYISSKTVSATRGVANFDSAGLATHDF